MSSPAGLQAQQSQTNFLAKWIPSSSRAGVILNPSPDLAESLRHSSIWGSKGVDDSFASQFVPLPVSSSSSCLSVSSLDHDADSRKEFFNQNHQPGERTVSDRQFAAMHTSASQGLTLPAEMEGIEKFVEQSQDLPLMLKLQQLRQWQQHMQEQLKAHQLEELVRLQEEQQRLLGMMNVAQRNDTDSIETSTMTGGDSGEGSVLDGCPLSDRPQAAPSHPIGSQQEPASSQNWRPVPTFQPPSSKDQDETLGTDAWSSPYEHHQLSRDDHGDDEDLDEVNSSSHSAPAVTRDGQAYRVANIEPDSRDRPIKPGIGGQKQTFEELLEEQLRLEAQRLTSGQQRQGPAGVASPRASTKRAFLRRGEGLSRFTNKSKAPPLNQGRPQTDPKPQAKVSTRRAPEPKPIHRVSQRPPVQRKTAVVNKENRPRDACSPPVDSSRPEGKAKPRVLGSHHRQNAETPGCLRPNTVISNSVAGSSQPGCGTPAAVTKQFGLETRTRAPPSDGGGPLNQDGPVKGSGDVVPEYSFELSFQEKLQHWDCERQQENVELGEFELLEQAAEELSFSSNSSFVMKVLQLDQLNPNKVSKGYQPRRLSSTPVKSPKPSASEGVHSRVTVGSGQGTGPSVPSSSAVGAKDGGMWENSQAIVEEEEAELGGSKQHEDISDISSHSSSESEESTEIARPPYQSTFPSSLWENPHPASTPPYNQRSYQDREASSGQAAEGGESDLDGSTLLEDRDEGGRQGQLMFDDDDTWNDLEEAGGTSEACGETRGGATGNSHPPTTLAGDAPERMLKRKVAVAKGAELDGVSVTTPANQELDAPPPASQLMARLFPSLKPKSRSPPQPELGKMEEAPGQQQQSRQLRERLVEMELEIERFRTENAALARLRQENEKIKDNLGKERAEFEQRKAEELAKIEEFKREETRKLQKERRVFEKHASAARAMPDKRERDEIQALKQQLSSLQEELKRRESRWSNAHSRLRQQIDTLSSENGALRDEVRTLEKLRLSTWGKTGTDSDRERDRREREKEGTTQLGGGVAFGAGGLKSTSPETVRNRPSPSSSSSRSSPPEPSHRGAIRGILKRSGPPPPPAPGPPPSHNAEASTSGSQDQSSRMSPGGLQTADSMQVKGQQDASQEVIAHPDGKMEKILACGGRLLVFPNGTRKEMSADGLTAKVTFFNGDIKQVMADQRVIYYYAEAQTTHTTYPDGMEVLQFPSNQTEKHFPDGRKEITYPDQTIKNLYPDGREESVLTDGTIIQVNLSGEREGQSMAPMPWSSRNCLHTLATWQGIVLHQEEPRVHCTSLRDGSKEIQFNTGQKEIHTGDYKRREYPDGTVKTVYTDGRQETRYPTGRLRVKDKDGHVVIDNRP